MNRPDAPAPARWPFLLLAASLVLVGPILWRCYRPATALFDVSGFQYGHDFINDWTAPRLAFHGHVLQLFDLRAYAGAMNREFGHVVPVHNWSYPPFLLPFLAPFAALPYLAGLAAWLLVLAPLYVLAASRLFVRRSRWIVPVLLLASPAALLNIAGGQNGFITGALLLGGMALLPRRPILAGVLFGLLTMKPQLGIALATALLALGAWRTIAAAVATVAALVGQSVLLFGWAPWAAYVTTTRNVHLGLLKGFDGFYTKVMCSVMANARFDGLAYAPAVAVQAVCTLAVLATVVWAVRRTSDWRMRTLVVALAGPLATPYAFDYDMTAAAAVLLWRLLEETPPVPRAAYALAWLAPALTMTLAMNGLGVMALPPLLAYAACLAEVGRRPATPAVAHAPHFAAPEPAPA